MSQVLNRLTSLWESLKGTDGAAHVFASATSSAAVTPSDATVLDYDALYIGTGGSVVIKHTEAGSAVAFASVSGGTILPVAGVRVMAATTASNIVYLKW